MTRDLKTELFVKRLALHHYYKILNNTDLLLQYLNATSPITLEGVIALIYHKTKKLKEEIDALEKEMSSMWKTVSTQ